ncbi:hypothetical protein EDD16DRAFT_1515656 [Pisolithus croceorrhizus]|nr:hypothetical protein EDD16DRAFT_1515656 [Pisolithus croceorrhizus]
MAAQITSNLPLGERKKEKKFVRKATADILNTTHGHVHTKTAEFLSPKVSYQAQKDINVVDDMVRPQFEARRALWSSKITNAQLNEQVDAFGGGISHMFQEDSDVLLLLNDGSEFLIANLALAKYSIAAMTLCSPKLLSLVGKYEGKHHQKTAKQVEITPWVQIETDGTNKTKRCRRVPNIPMTRIRSPSSKHPLGECKLALHENASFATIDSTRLYDVTRVGVTWSLMDAMQLRNGQPHNLAERAVCKASPHSLPDGESWLYSFAWKHKLVAFAEGFLSKDSLWGHMVFDHAWEHVLGDMANALKDVIISGGPISSEVFMPAQIALSILMINVHVNPWVLPSGHEPVHVGGPSINVEAKLKGVKGTYLEDNENPVREIVVCGPTVGVSIGEETENVV